MLGLRRCRRDAPRCSRSSHPTHVGGTTALRASCDQLGARSRCLRWRSGDGIHRVLGSVLLRGSIIAGRGSGRTPQVRRQQGVLHFAMKSRGIRAHGVKKAFGPVQALDGVDLDVRAGQITALLGRNGAGKSTLIRILATAILPDGGDVWVDGLDVVANSAGVRKRIGLVLGDERSHFWRLSGLQNLEFFAALHGLTADDARRSAREALAAVGLADVAKQRVDRYSTGMRSRLGIARSLLGSPSVLLLDEPTRSLDPGSAYEVRGLVRGLVEDRGVAVLLATHDLHEAAAMADQVIVLDRGRVLEQRGGGESAADLEAVVVGTRA
jgi:ABC-type multidrug transport system ATPase subunit